MVRHTTGRYFNDYNWSEEYWFYISTRRQLKSCSNGKPGLFGGTVYHKDGFVYLVLADLSLLYDV